MTRWFRCGFNVRFFKASAEVSVSLKASMTENHIGRKNIQAIARLKPISQTP